VLDLPSGATALIVGSSRAAADELAASIGLQKGGLFGVARTGYQELITRLSIEQLAREGLNPASALSAEAVAARAAFEAVREHALTYFAPVASLPGFPRALSRTLAELRLAGVGAHDLTRLRSIAAEQDEIDRAGGDLARLLAGAGEQAAKAQTVDRARLLETATRVLQSERTFVSDTTIVLLDVAIATEADAAFARALIRSAKRVVATVPAGDGRTLAALSQLATFEPATNEPGTSGQGVVERSTASALQRLQTFLFSKGAPPRGETDETVRLFSAPGEGRECVEIARRVLDEAAHGVRFDEMAVVLRAPQTYVGLLEHAFLRAGIPAWFDRGTRRPDPSGRAFLALLACAEEDLSARRFAEYLSLGQVPSPDQRSVDTWSTPIDDVVEALVPAAERSEDPDPEHDAQLASEEDAHGPVVAGTLRAPWRWEELLVESAVIGRLDRWERRLKGLAAEYRRKLEELGSDEPDSPRLGAIQRDIDQLQHLASFALPIVRELASWPRAGARWGDWLELLQAFAPRVLRQPTRVQRVVQELGPLAEIGPVSLREVREVLTPRLLTLTHEPPRRRHGRVFVGTPHAARGRVFRTVFIPGLAERVFPQRLREDALLLDDRRQQLPVPLTTQKQRADDERLQLRVAVGAAAERVYVSWPRLELQESRPRVPSFYVLDVVRAVEGSIPAYATIRDRAFAAGASTLAWPAPAEPTAAIDEFEHDLSMLYQLLRETDHERAKGRARYLYELSPHLQRSLTGRWARWQKRWHPTDGLIHSTAATAPALARQRLGQRPFSLTALQRYAECPYQFQLSAIYQLRPLEAPAPLQRLDPLTRGSLFHSIQTEFFRALEKNGLLPVTEKRADAARKMLEWAITTTARTAKDDLAPAIERVWQDEMASIARDLRGWLHRLVEDGKEWRPERFEFAFGLPGDTNRDPRSVPTPARIDGRFLIRGSIDLVERRVDGRSLRVTDHKTGKNRTKMSTMVDGGRVLQPLLYGMALESLTGETVEEGRLSFCTSVGAFAVHPIALDELSRRRAIEVLEVVDRAIENGLLAARPSDGACARCDFTAVCGSLEEQRTRRKVGALFADLDALRKIP